MYILEVKFFKVKYQWVVSL